MRRLSMFAVAYLVSVFAITGRAEAAIQVGDWHLTTDNLGGLRQSTFDASVWYAVSQSTDWQEGEVYVAPTGFHWASTAEGKVIFGDNANTSGVYVYYNQGGWSGYQWESAARYEFRFSDSHVTGAYKHAGNYDEFQVQYGSHSSDDSAYFAGLVLIQDDSAVPEPTSLLSCAGLGLCFAASAWRKRRK